MSKKFYIYPHRIPGADEYQKPDKNGYMDATVHYLVGYCPITLGEYKKMIKVLKEDFEQIIDDEVECGKITSSRIVKGFTIVSWSGRINVNELPEKYYISEKFDPEYYWG